MMMQVGHIAEEACEEQLASTSDTLHMLQDAKGQRSLEVKCKEAQVQTRQETFELLLSPL